LALLIQIDDSPLISIGYWAELVGDYSIGGNSNRDKKSDLCFICDSQNGVRCKLPRPAHQRVVEQTIGSFAALFRARIQKRTLNPSNGDPIRGWDPKSKEGAPKSWNWDPRWGLAGDASAECQVGVVRAPPGSLWAGLFHGFPTPSDSDERLAPRVHLLRRRAWRHGRWCCVGTNGCYQMTRR
jgi:hypothetical protein